MMRIAALSALSLGFAGALMIGAPKPQTDAVLKYEVRCGDTVLTTMERSQVDEALRAAGAATPTPQRCTVTTRLVAH